MSLKNLAFVRLLLVITFVIFALPMISAAESNTTLSWDANNSAPQGYRLYWRAEGQSYNFYQYFETGRTTSQTVYGLDEYTTYYFVVRAYVGNTVSSESNEVSFNARGVSSTSDNNPPIQPYTVSPEGDALDVPLETVLRCGAFDDPDSADRHIQSRWQVYREDNGALALDVVSNTDLMNLTVPAGALQGDTSYYWTISHTNQIGASSPPSLVSYFTTAADGSGSSSNLGGGSDGGGGGGFGGTGCMIQTIRH